MLGAVFTCHMPHRSRRTESEHDELTKRLGLAIGAVLGVVLVAGLWLIIRGLF